jgi:hypothetical protein
MRLFKLEPRFSSTTGKPISPQCTSAGLLCDFCGKKIDPDDDFGDIRYEIIEAGGSEPQFHELRIKGYEDISIYTVMRSEFVFCANWDTREFCEAKMMKAAIKNKENPFTLVCYAMYDARIKMLAKVLDKKLYTLEELQLNE